MVDGIPGSTEGGALPRRSHLAPFLESPRPYIVLARNAVPVVGVFWLDWSPALSVLVLWFDGLTALAAMLAFQTRAFGRNDPEPQSLGWLVSFWLFLVALLPAPYWFMALAFAGKVVPAGWATFAAGNPTVWTALSIVLVANIADQWLKRYERLPDVAIRAAFSYAYALHIARSSAILLIGMFLPVRYAVPALAAALSYVEIYPMRSLRVLGGEALLDPQQSRGAD